MLAAKVLAATAEGVPTPGLSWQSRYFREDIEDVAWSSTLGLFAAVGQIGTVLTSPDGVTWTLRTTPATVTLKGIVWTGTAFVATGSSQAIRSTNGINWTTTSSSMGTANGIAYSPGSGLLPGAVVLAVGSAAAYRRSTNDGASFASGTVGGSSTNYAVAWAPIGASASLFAVTSGSNVYTSPEGTAWTLRSVATGLTLRSITWASGPNLFVAGSSIGSFYYSANGTTWTLSSFSLPVSVIVTRIIYANSLYIAVTNAGTIYTTPNITTTGWTQRVFSTPTALNTVVWNDTTFLAMGNGTATYTSSAGTTWTFQNTGTLYSLSGVTWGNNLFVAVGAGGQIITSSDTTTWTTRTSGTTDLLNAVAYASALNVFVAVGFGSLILYSSNGIIWSTAGSIGYAGEDLSAIAWDGAAFWVTSGNSSRIFKSFDGVNWSLATIQGSDNQGIASDGVSGVTGKLVIAEYLDDVVYSTNGGSFWTSTTSGLQYNNFVTYAGTVFLLVGSANLQVFTSPTGATWTARQTPTSEDMYTAASASSTNAVVLGGNALSKTSVNAIVSTNNSANWAPATSNPTSRFRGVAYSPTLGRYVAVGEYGIVAISAPITGLATTL